MAQLYDRIGIGYREQRRADPRIAAAIVAALGDAAPVLNVGAGTGSYEPADRAVCAVEPSREMVRQRAAYSAPAVRASAVRLPFVDRAFGAALAILTVHHWPDPARGLREMMRVSRERVVVLTFDPAFTGFWLIDDYLPEIREVDRRSLPTIDEVVDALGGAHVHVVPVPHDCSDGFLGAFWRRPEAYLDARVRAAISAFSKLDDPGPGLARLRADLEDGRWAQRYGDLLALPEIDLGYRLVVARR